MRNYRKRQIVKVYKQCRTLFKHLLCLESQMQPLGFIYVRPLMVEVVRNRAYCSILNHCCKGDDVRKVFK